MTKMHRYAAIAALAIFLSGCMAQRQPAPVEEVNQRQNNPRSRRSLLLCRLCQRFHSNRGRSNMKIKRASQRLRCATMTGTARCNRWSAKCCRLMA